MRLLLFSLILSSTLFLSSIAQATETLRANTLPPTAAIAINCNDPNHPCYQASHHTPALGKRLYY